MKDTHITYVKAVDSLTKETKKDVQNAALKSLKSVLDRAGNPGNFLMLVKRARTMVLSPVIKASMEGRMQAAKLGSDFLKAKR